MQVIAYTRHTIPGPRRAKNTHSHTKPDLTTVKFCLFSKTYHIAVSTLFATNYSHPVVTGGVLHLNLCEFVKPPIWGPTSDLALYMYVQYSGCVPFY